MVTTIIKGGFTLLIFGVVAYGIRYCWVSFPIAAGYGAKVLCSSVFVAGRKEADVKARELSFMPLNLVKYQVNYQDSSVTASILGMAVRKAIYRKGLGATLISEWPEEKVKEQQFRLAAAPCETADSLPWPMGNRMVDTLPHFIDKKRLEAALDNSFREKDTADPVYTRAVVVVHDGQLIAERYAPGFTKDTRLTGWSMTKSITGALIGLLVKQNKLDIEAPAPVPEWQSENDPRRAITVKQLLQQSSGLQFEENYSKSTDATIMLFQRADMGAYAADHALKDSPGTFFNYSSGNSNILSRIIRHAVGEEGYHAFPYEQLLYKLGMYSAMMEPDASGTFVGSSYCFATARDWARFGLLYLNDGMCNQERLLPEGWVKQSTTPAPAATEGQYGFQFWLNAGRPDDPTSRPFPSVPADMFYASGFEGQDVFIIPSKKLVVVRLGLTRSGDYGADQFLKEIISSIH